ncbi:MAG: flotillin family protein, partial [Bacteroidota bacterium]
MFESLGIIIGVVGVVFTLGIVAMIAQFYKKASQGQALVRTGTGGVKVSFNGMMVFPVFHRLEVMDISLKSF